jgi:hypothetical protein
LDLVIVGECRKGQLTAPPTASGHSEQLLFLTPAQVVRGAIAFVSGLAVDAPLGTGAVRDKELTCASPEGEPQRSKRAHSSMNDGKSPADAGDRKG